MTLAFIVSNNKCFCIDITQTIYSDRFELVHENNKMTQYFYDFISVMISKDELENIDEYKVYCFDSSNIKDPMVYAGVNILKHTKYANE